MNKSLMETCVMLIMKYPFYGLFLSELNKRIDSKFPTACVSKHQDSPNIELVIGENFWEKVCKTDEMKMGILIHELEHVIRGHLTVVHSLYSEDKRLANIAMDIAINQDISLPLPKYDENGERIGAFLEDYKDMGLLPHESSLYYYRIFLQKKEDKKQSKSRGEDSKCGSPGNKNGTCGSESMDSTLEAIERGEMNDWHSLWDKITEGMTDAEKQLLEKEITASIERTLEEVEKKRGDVPLHLKNILKDRFEIKTPVVPWSVLFKRFVGSTLSTTIFQSRKRPNPRFDDAPINKQKFKTTIICGVDASGSVGQGELKQFFNELYHMHKTGVKITLAHWDTQVHKVEEYTGQRTIERVCAGGTYASSFIEYVNKHKREFTCAICLTDGYIESDPIPCSVPLLWVISSSGTTEFNHRSKKVKIN